MKLRIAVVVTAVAALLFAASVDYVQAQQQTTSGKSKAAPSGTVMRMNAQGQMQAAPRTGDSFPGCVKGGIGLGYSRAAAEGFCFKKLRHR
jgi:hypothetical protein